jgi:TonB family protein
MRFRLTWMAVIPVVLAGASVRAADPVWIEVSSPNFILYTDTTELKGRRLLEDFERRVASLSTVLGEIPARQFPVEILLFSKREEFLETAPKPAGPEAPPEFDKSAYLWRGPDRIFIGARDRSPEDIADDVGHALGHVFFERVARWRPHWLAEASAEYFRKIGRNPDTKRFSEKDGYPASDLLEIVQSRDYDDELRGTPFRIQAHRLLRVVANGHREALRDFIRDLRAEAGGEAKLNVPTDALQSALDAFTETRLEPTSVSVTLRARTPAAEVVSIHRGDLLLAARNTSEAAAWYKGDSKDSRAARAILARFSRGGAEPIRALDRASRELPESGLVQFHFGSIETKVPADIELQSRALERAVELLPRLGRANGHLARVYALLGRGDDALAQIDRALEAEPEYADEFYAIRSDALLSLSRYAEAIKAIQTAAALPHHDRSQDYNFRASEMVRRVEQTRREAENRRLQQIRTEVAAQVAEREPTPVPPPRSTTPTEKFGSIQYTVQASRPLSVTSAPLPIYRDALVQRGAVGNVTIQITIGADGRVTQASIADSQLPEMNASSLDAVRRWTFSVPAGGRGAATLTARIVFTFAVQ